MHWAWHCFHNDKLLFSGNHPAQGCYQRRLQDENDDFIWLVHWWISTNRTISLQVLLEMTGCLVRNQHFRSENGATTTTASIAWIKKPPQNDVILYWKLTFHSDTIKRSWVFPTPEQFCSGNNQFNNNNKQIKQTTRKHSKTNGMYEISPSLLHVRSTQFEQTGNKIKLRHAKHTYETPALLVNSMGQ